MVITLKFEDKAPFHLHCDKIEINQINSNLLLHLSKNQNNTKRIAEAGLILGRGNQLIISFTNLVEIR